MEKYAIKGIVPSVQRLFSGVLPRKSYTQASFKQVLEAHEVTQSSPKQYPEFEKFIKNYLATIADITRKLESNNESIESPLENFLFSQVRILYNNILEDYKKFLETDKTLFPEYNGHNSSISAKINASLEPGVFRTFEIFLSILRDPNKKESRTIEDIRNILDHPRSRDLLTLESLSGYWHVIVTDSALSEGVPAWKVSEEGFIEYNASPLFMPHPDVVPRAKERTGCPLHFMRNNDQKETALMQFAELLFEFLIQKTKQHQEYKRK